MILCTHRRRQNLFHPRLALFSLVLARGEERAPLWPWSCCRVSQISGALTRQNAKGAENPIKPPRRQPVQYAHAQKHKRGNKPVEPLENQPREGVQVNSAHTQPDEVPELPREPGQLPDDDSHRCIDLKATCLAAGRVLCLPNEAFSFLLDT